MITVLATVVICDPSLPFLLLPAFVLVPRFFIFLIRLKFGVEHGWLIYGTMLGIWLAWTLWEFCAFGLRQAPLATLICSTAGCLGGFTRDRCNEAAQPKALIVTTKSLVVIGAVATIWLAWLVVAIYVSQQSS